MLRPVLYDKTLHVDVLLIFIIVIFNIAIIKLRRH